MPVGGSSEPRAPVEELCQVRDVKSQRTQMWLPSLALEPAGATVSNVRLTHIQKQ